MDIHQMGREKNGNSFRSNRETRIIGCLSFPEWIVLSNQNYYYYSSVYRLRAHLRELASIYRKNTDPFGDNYSRAIGRHTRENSYVEATAISNVDKIPFIREKDRETRDRRRRASFRARARARAHKPRTFPSFY